MLDQADQSSMAEVALVVYPDLSVALKAHLATAQVRV